MPEFIQERKSSDGKHTTYKVCIPYTLNGKRKYYTESFSSKKYGSKKIALDLAKEARDKAKNRLLDNPTSVAKSDVTLNEVFELRKTVYSRSAQTERRVKSIYNKFILPVCNENTVFRTITHNEIFESLERVKTTSTDDTIQRIFSLWKQLYKAAILNDIVQIDQTTKVIAPKSLVPNKVKKQTTSFDEMHEVCLELINRHQNKYNAYLIAYALYIMYYTGIRPAECYALSRDNIDLDNRLMTISQSVSLDEDREGFISKTKNERSIRTIPYPQELDEVFKELYEMSNNNLLFIKDNGKLMTGCYASACIRTITKGKFHSYNLRHQFATDLILANTDIRTVQELMGHTNSSMTISYARSNQKEMQKAISNRNSVAKTVAKN